MDKTYLEIVIETLQGIGAVFIVKDSDPPKKSAGEKHTNIIEQMIADRIASNPFEAAHIANGLQLEELTEDQEKVKRYRLYRAWRNAGEPPKVSYANAIAGLMPMQFVGVLDTA